MLAGVPGVAGSDWNNFRFAGVLGALLAWLHWVDGGSGPPPWNLLWFALILEPKCYGIHTYVYIHIHTYTHIYIHTYTYIRIAT